MKSPGGQRCVCQEAEPVRGALGTARPLGQQGFDVGLDVDGRKAAAVSAHRNAVPAHQELLEVPGNVVAAHWRPDDELRIGHERGGVVTGRGQSLPQEGEERVRLCAVHLALLEEREVGLEPAAGSDVLERIQDLFVFGVFLREERAAETRGREEGNLLDANKEFLDESPGSLPFLRNRGADLSPARTSAGGKRDSGLAAALQTRVARPPAPRT